MITTGLFRYLVGDAPVAESAESAESAQYGITAEPHEAHLTGPVLVMLVLRAFSQGCTALTGVEAISNGVPAVRKPKPKNAATTMAVMGAISITMFVGVTHPGADGEGPRHRRLMPPDRSRRRLRQPHPAHRHRPGRGRGLRRRAQHRFLQANVTNLIHLYILGVFTSFTLSQTGMVRHWNRELLAEIDPALRRHHRITRVINGTGAVVTGLVLLIVLATKFTQGARLAVLAVSVLWLMMRGIRRHYGVTAAELAVTDPRSELAPPSRAFAIVLVSTIHKPTLRALSYARAFRPHQLEALTVSVDRDEAARLRDRWEEYGIEVPLKILDSPYREVTRPVVDYVRSIRRDSPRDIVAVFIPEYVAGHWWENLLHNQSALWLKSRLLFTPGVMVTSVPWQLTSSARADRPAARAPGSVRRGEPPTQAIQSERHLGSRRRP
nr:hypothetical protein [Streptomyces albicerus]